jgi:hypothetical protein
VTWGALILVPGPVWAGTTEGEPVRKILKRGAVGVLAGVLAAAIVLAASPSTAALSGRTSTFTDRQQYRTENAAWATNITTGYVYVPGAVLTVVVPAGTRRMLDVFFSAESQCVGASGWCTVRPIVRYPSGAVIELDPIAGTDYAFDSAKPSGPTGQWGSHAFKRTSPYLPAGTYRVYIQARLVAGATSVRLDVWTLAVEVERP